MRKNVGTIDRTIRVLVGLALIASALLGYFDPWGWIGVVPLLTGLSGFCPAYLPFGISSCKIKGSGRA